MTAVDWVRYRQCPVCKAKLGEPCMTRSGALVEGVGYVADGATLLREQPHSTRELRTGYGREVTR